MSFKKFLAVIVSIAFDYFTCAFCWAGCYQYFEQKNFFGFGHGIFMIVSFVYSLVVAGFCFYSLKTILEPKDKDKEDENT